MFISGCECSFQYRFRRLTCADIPAVKRLFISQRALPAALEEQLEPTLRRGLETRYLFGSVAERLRKPGGDWELAGFGLAGFMSDAFVERYFEEPFAFLAVEILEAIRRQEPEAALLPWREVAQRQRTPESRLVLAIPCWLQDNLDPDSEDAWHLIHTATGIVDRHLRGFRLRALVLEAMRTSTLLLEAAGFERLFDMREAAEGSRWRHLRGDARYRPMLHAVHTREYHRGRQTATPVAALFMFREPYLELTDNQKAVLDLAVDDYSDEEIAELLGLSTNAVRKRWRGIYEKMEKKITDIFSGVEKKEGLRGHEKRRLALAWIRQHPEEIRPGVFMPPCGRD